MASTSDNKEWITQSEAADILQVRLAYVSQMAAEGRIRMKIEPRQPGNVRDPVFYLRADCERHVAVKQEKIAAKLAAAAAAYEAREAKLKAKAAKQKAKAAKV